MIAICHHSNSLALFHKPHFPLMLKACCKSSFLLLEIPWDNKIWVLALTFLPSELSMWLCVLNQRPSLFWGLPPHSGQWALYWMSLQWVLLASAWASSAYSDRHWGWEIKGGETLSHHLSQADSGDGQSHHRTPSLTVFLKAKQRPCTGLNKGASLPLPGWGGHAAPKKGRGHPNTLQWGRLPLWVICLHKPRSSFLEKELCSQASFIGLVFATWIFTLLLRRKIIILCKELSLKRGPAGLLCSQRAARQVCSQHPALACFLSPSSSESLLTDHCAFLIHHAKIIKILWYSGVDLKKSHHGKPGEISINWADSSGVMHRGWSLRCGKRITGLYHNEGT